MCRNEEDRFDKIRFSAMALPDQALILILMELALHGLAGWQATKAVDQICGDFAESDVKERAYSLRQRVCEWNRRPLTDSYPFLMVDAHPVRLYGRDGGAFLQVLSAVGISGSNGHRDCIGFTLADGSEESWKGFFESLMKRGLTVPRLITAKRLPRMTKAAGSVFPSAKIQRCQEDLAAAAMRSAPSDRQKDIRHAVKQIFAAPTKEAAETELSRFAEKYRADLPECVALVEQAFPPACAVYCFPRSVRPRLAVITTSFRKLNESLTKREKILTCYPGPEAVDLLVGSVFYSFSMAWFTSVHPFLSISDYRAFLKTGCEPDCSVLTRRSPLYC